MLTRNVTECSRSQTQWTETSQPPVPYASLLTISSTFHPLFKVLFTFPSQYFFAIGLSEIFSFRWDLSPFRAAISNNPTHWNADTNRRCCGHDQIRDSHPLWWHVQIHLNRDAPTVTDESKNYNSTTSEKAVDFKFEPSLLHSPLLKTS